MVLTLKSKILLHLLKDRTLPKTIRQISLDLKTDYKNVYGAIKLLESSLNIHKLATQMQITVKPKLTSDLFAAESIRVQNILKHEAMQILASDLAAIKSPFFIPVLFGSYAKGSAQKRSDIDLCIICDDTKLLASIENKMSLYPVKVRLQVFSVAEFISMVQTKEFNVAHEILAHGIALRNTESYYKVISFGL